MKVCIFFRLIDVIQSITIWTFIEFIRRSFIDINKFKNLIFWTWNSHLRMFTYKSISRNF